MTCPACKTDNGITDSVSSGGLVTRERCGDAWHAARLASWPFDPDPPKLIPAENGYRWCGGCDSVVEAKGHECGREARLLRAFELEDLALAALVRAEFAESLLMALAFDTQRLVIDVRHGEGCDPRHPDRDCIFCIANRNRP